jgi:hypothetical protein
MSSPDWEEILGYEDRIAKVLEIRSRRDVKGWWEATGVVPALTAVLTVAVTSLGSYFVQVELRSGEQAERITRETAEAEMAALTTTYQLATASLHYTDERARIARHHYSMLKPEQLRRLIDSVNVNDSRWREGRDAMRLPLGLRFGEYPAILASWDTLVLALNQYSGCSVDTSQSSCAPLRVRATAASTAFREAVLAHVRSHLDSRMVHPRSRERQEPPISHTSPPSFMSP